MLVSPTNFMMKGVRGFLMMSLGVPCCSMRPRLKITTLSAKSKASSWSCVTIMVVTPTLRTISLSPARRDLRTTASNAPKGSSSNSNFGLLAKALARATRCRWPPLSCLGKRSPRPSNCTSSNKSCARWLWSIFKLRTSSPNLMFSAIVLWLNSAYDWNTKPISRSCTGVFVAS
mmetsp:Transcript_21004/g.35839  ORF Transcript_21004/g.35839 Transcript_21004/m.35839 type:complete len:174 (-) Transcript_21004:676-1197(-)